MNQNLIELVLIVDASSSMNSLLPSTVSSFKEYCLKQLEVPGEINITLCTFSDTPTIHFSGRDLRQDSDILLNEGNLLTWFRPFGCTALRDAIGLTCLTVGERLANTKESERPSKVMVVIITDGYENASKKYTQAEIRQIIDLQHNVYKWEFVFVGANQDAVLQAQQYNITHGLTFNATTKGIMGTFSALADSTNRYRSNEPYTISSAERLRAKG